MDFLIYFYLAIFPFGKTLGNLSDVIIIFICLWAFVKGYKFKTNNFILICVFSLLFSLSFFKLPQILVGIMYLVRLISYVFFAQILKARFGNSKIKREFLFNALIAIGFFIAFFGWIQYLFFPDLRALKVFGWDDHYYRLVSTFLDPAFTGIFLVLAEILVVLKTIKKNTRVNISLNIIFVFTILFTYSRASYLALLFSFAFLFLKYKKKAILFLSILFIFLMPILPKPGGQGVNLARTYSIIDRFDNYRESILLIKKSPVFGIGFNNVCIATARNSSSHSCSGLDNGLLFITATTGVVGLIVFIQTIFRLIRNTRKDIYGTAIMVSLMAIFVHGMFTATFFYSFVMGWVGILWVVSDF